MFVIVSIIKDKKLVLSVKKQKKYRIIKITNNMYQNYDNFNYNKQKQLKNRH